MKDNIELQNTNEESRELLLIKTLAHDLTSPIRTIYGYTCLLEDSNCSFKENELKEIYKIINELAENAINQAEMLAKFNFDIEQLIQNHVEFSFPTLIRNLLNEYTTRLDEKYLRVKSQINLSQGTIKANKYSLSIIIRNLIDNAVKFSPCHSEIVLSVEEEDQKIKFSLFNLFDKQTLLHLDRKSTINIQIAGNNGLGLGLCNCKQIASIANIVLQFESIHGNGFLASVVFSNKP